MLDQCIEEALLGRVFSSGQFGVPLDSNKPGVIINLCSLNDTICRLGNNPEARGWLPDGLVMPGGNFQLCLLKDVKQP